MDYKVVYYRHFYLIRISFGYNTTLRGKDCQPTAELTSTCLKTAFNDHPASLEMTYG